MARRTPNYTLQAASNRSNDTHNRISDTFEDASNTGNDTAVKTGMGLVLQLECESNVPKVRTPWLVDLRLSGN